MAEKLTDYIPNETLTAIDRYFAQARIQAQAEEISDGKSFRVGVARTRFKEGFTDEAGFTAELQSLGVSDAEITQELVAGRLDYATDYTRDLIVVYRDAVRNGNLSIDGYLEKLVELGIVADRAHGYAVREYARQKPTEAIGLDTLAIAAYETEAGKLQLDTLRRQRRKNLITRDQELAGILALGTPQGLAEAMVANDDVRISSKEGE